MVYPYQNNTFFQTARYPRLPVTPFPKNQSCPIDLFNSTEPDYSKMTLREELEYRLNDMKRQQQEKEEESLFSKFTADINDKLTAAENYSTEIYENYFGPRNAFNRYKHSCTMPNVVYNLISSQRTAPANKIITTKNPIADKMLSTAIATIFPQGEKAVNAINKMYQGGNLAASLQNSLQEAGCLNLFTHTNKGEYNENNF